MSQAPDNTKIISLDLTTHTDDTLDVMGDFPITETHVVPSIKPRLDTIDKKVRGKINLHTPQTVRIPSSHDILTLDIVPTDMSRKR
jgi:hypothetical protein